MQWQQNLIDNRDGLKALLLNTQRIAVLGIKTEQQAHLPAFYVPQYMHQVGYEIIPVPIYYPDVEMILGQKVYRCLADIPGEIDLVNVFRRSHDLNQHVKDIQANAPQAVWLQSGIRNDDVAEELARAGIKVVQDRCLMIEHRRAKS